MIQCQQCGSENQNDIQHCQACGAHLFRPAERPCAKCGISNELGTRYCKGCGNILLPLVVPQRKPNSEHSKRVTDLNADPAATSANDPAMPEWVTRFASQTPPPKNETPKPEEAVNQVTALLRRIFGLAPDEISSIQIRKKNGETVDLSANAPDLSEIKRSKEFRWQ